MGFLLLATGIFAGVGIAIATFYSLAQAIMLEGRPRLAHIAVILLTLAAMAALQYHYVQVARFIALPLLAAAAWAFAVERRWFRVFPLLQQLFAVVLLAGGVTT